MAGRLTCPECGSEKLVNIDQTKTKGATEYERQVAGERTEFEASGILWWNRLTKKERRDALVAVGPDATVAKAYQRYLEIRDAVAQQRKGD